MKLSMNREELIKIIAVLVIVTTYGSLPDNVKLYMPLIFCVYFGYKMIIYIIQKKYWDEIMRMAVLFLLFLAGFFHGYIATQATSFNLKLITLLIAIWMFPALVYTLMGTMKRTGDINRLKFSVLFLYFCIAISVVFTIVVILA